MRTANGAYKYKQRELVESTCVISAKNPPKTKLEWILYNSRVSELEKSYVSWFVKVLRFI